MHNKMGHLAYTVVAISLVGCQSGTPTVPMPTAVAQRLVFDRTVSASDRESIQGVASAFTSSGMSIPNDIVYVDSSGNIVANSAHARSLVRRWTKKNGNLYQSDRGDIAAFPDSSAEMTSKSGTRVAQGIVGSPPAATSSGPYQRFFTQAGPPSTTANGLPVAPPTSLQYYVMAACNATHEDGVVTYTQGPFGDTGYVYSGGWAGDGNNVLDIGLQYSAARQQFDGFYKWGTDKAPTTYSLGFSCGHVLSVSYALAGPTLSFGSTGSWYPIILGITDVTTNQSFGTKIQFYDSQPQDWNAWVGGYQIVKLMTSIAQNVSTSDPSYRAGTNADGFTFGLDGNGAPSISLSYDFRFDVGYTDQPAQSTQAVPNSWNVVTGSAATIYRDGGYFWPIEMVGIYQEEDRQAAVIPTPTPRPISTPNPCTKNPRLCE